MKNHGKISINIRIVSFFMVILCTSIFYISQAKTLICSRVIDGDTFLVNNSEKFRLIGVDTTETKHPQKQLQYFVEEAYAVIKWILEGKKVR
jgi:endonuclease YncB( thermonuclease family)